MGYDRDMPYAVEHEVLSTDETTGCQNVPTKRLRVLCDPAQAEILKGLPAIGIAAAKRDLVSQVAPETRTSTL